MDPQVRNASGMKELRANLEAVVGKALGKDWRFVRSYFEVLDVELKKPTLLLARQRVTRASYAPNALLDNTFALHLIAPENASEDQLDDWLDDLLEALEETGYRAWDDIQRDDFGQKARAFTITLHATTTRKK